MKITSTRSTEPLSVTFTITLDEADLVRTVDDPADPDAKLFYALFAGTFERKAPSEKLATIVKRVRGIEAAERLKSTHAK